MIKPVKVIILGGAGAMASVVIKDLLEFGEDISVTIADTRPVEVIDPRIRGVAIDVRNESETARIIEGHDVTINCVNYYWNTHVMRATLRARVPYIDLGGLYHETKNQFLLHHDFVQAGIPAVLGMGSTPGITNVMAGVVARQFDSVEEIHIRVGCYDETVSGPLPVPYALDTILDEFAMPPMLLVNGSEVAATPGSGSEIIDFPAPAGRMEAIWTLHSEVAMFPRSFPELRAASFKVAFPPDFAEKVRFLVELGFASKENLLNGVSPRAMLLALTRKAQQPESEPRDCDVLRVDVTGVVSGKRLTRRAESIILPHPVWKIAAGALDTGVPISVVAQMLAQKIISEPGVLCPEISVPADLFLAEIAKRGITVRFYD